MSTKTLLTRTMKKEVKWTIDFGGLCGSPAVGGGVIQKLEFELILQNITTLATLETCHLVHPIQLVAEAWNRNLAEDGLNQCSTAIIFSVTMVQLCRMAVWNTIQRSGIEMKPYVQNCRDIVVHGDGKDMVLWMSSLPLHHHHHASLGAVCFISEEFMRCLNFIW